jgi:hypothetical protein
LASSNVRLENWAMACVISDGWLRVLFDRELPVRAVPLIGLSLVSPFSDHLQLPGYRLPCDTANQFPLARYRE